MKQIACVAFLFLCVVACKKEKTPAVPEKPVSKKAGYHIFGSRDYSIPYYQNTTADLRLQIRLINYRSGAETLVWDSVFSTRKLASFPPYGQRLVVEKTIPVLESFQKLNVSYSIRYSQDGLISQEGKSDEAVPGVQQVLLEAGL